MVNGGDQDDLHYDDPDFNVSLHVHTCIMNRKSGNLHVIKLSEVGNFL